MNTLGATVNDVQLNKYYLFNTSPLSLVLTHSIRHTISTISCSHTFYQAHGLHYLLFSHILSGTRSQLSPFILFSEHRNYVMYCNATFSTRYLQFVFIGTKNTTANWNFHKNILQRILSWFCVYFFNIGILLRHMTVMHLYCTPSPDCVVNYISEVNGFVL